MSLYPHNLKNYMNISPLKFVCVICLISIALISCSENKKQSNSVAEIAENVSEEINKEGDAISNSIDELVENITETSPEIGVKLINNKEKDIELKYYVKNETETEIEIEPHESYYDKYFSGKRMDLEVHGGYTEGLYEFPTIDYYIVNNSDKPLNITTLDIIVSHSNIDSRPYIRVFSEEIHTEENYLVLGNYSCTNWGNLRLDYTILKKGERFNGKYNKTKVIPFFENLYSLNFTKELIEMGYNFKRVSEIGLMNLDFSDDNVNDAQELFYPFPVSKLNAENDNYYAYAPFYGRLRFSNFKIEVEFSTKILLMKYNGAGDGFEVKEKFDVKLNVSGNDYIKKYPYKATIPLGGSERVRLVIGSDKSSYHSFILKANNMEGIDLHSKHINLHIMNHNWATIVNDQSFNELPEEFDY